MRNLLRQSVTEAELRRLFAACPPMSLLPARGGASWRVCSEKPLTRKLLREILPRAEKDSTEPMPVLTDELYAEYSRTGNRSLFETVYFERRRRLARAVFLALFAPESDRWIPSLLRAWDDILAESSWALPAHVADPSGRDPFTIDLFGAETANLMAELLDLFGEEAGEGRRTAIRARLREQFFVNYVEGKDRFGWLKASHNWNAVCHQGVLGAALAVEDDPDLLGRMFFQAAQYLPNFLTGFTPDGGCSEGPAYWGYGFGWFAVLNEQLEARTRGELSLFHQDPLVREIARFGQRTMLSTERVANFADGSERVLPNPALLNYLADRLEDTSARSLAALRYQSLLEKPQDLDVLRADVFFLLRLVRGAPGEPEQAAAPAFENVFFPDLGWWISHGEDAAGTRWALAAKGGHNNEHHNHNDCGSCILLLNGRPFLDEIGAPEYTRDFFAAKRYGFLAARSLGHSLPIINGFEQAEGGAFAAKILKAEFGPDQDEFLVDLTACYPAVARCARAVRTFRLNREPFALEVIDDFAMDAPGVPVECALVTHARWHAEGGDILLYSGGETLRIQPVNGQFLRGENHPYLPHRVPANPVTLHRLVFAPLMDGATATLRLTLTHVSA